MSDTPRIILQHGLNGPVPWFKWLQKKCMERGFDVRVPLMTTAREPVRESWIQEMTASYGDITNSIIVAHSLGGLAVVHYLAALSADQVARAVIFVAAPARYTGKEKTEEFYSLEPHWDEARKHANSFIYIHSSDDTWVPADHGIVYEERLDAKRIEIDGEGHFLGNENELVWKEIQGIVSR